MARQPNKPEELVPREPISVPDIVESAAAIEKLERDISDIQAKLSQNILTIDDKEKQDRSREITQRIAIRFWISLVAVVVLALLFTLAGIGLCLVFGQTPIFWGHLLTVPSGYAIALFVAPIASVTAITVGLLYGAFRRFKEDDLDSFAKPAADVAQSLIGRQ